MNAAAFCEKCGFEPIALPSPEKEVVGAYAGDLLSWVMGRADSGNVWITIMSNVNIVAVATLADVGAILLSEGVKPDEDIVKLANAKGVNIFGTELSSYEAAVAVSRALE